MRLNEYVNKQRKNLEAESQKCETARNVLAAATGNPDLSAVQQIKKELQQQLLLLIFYTIFSP